MKTAVFDNPTVVWRPSPGNLRNIRTNFILPETTTVIGLYIFAADSVCLSSFIFSQWQWAPKTHVFCNRARSGQGHPRSLIFAPIESAYATSSCNCKVYFWSSPNLYVYTRPTVAYLNVTSRTVEDGTTYNSKLAIPRKRTCIAR